MDSGHRCVRGLKPIQSEPLQRDTLGCVLGPSLPQTVPAITSTGEALTALGSVWALPNAAVDILTPNRDQLQGGELGNELSEAHGLATSFPRTREAEEQCSHPARSDSPRKANKAQK